MWQLLALLAVPLIEIALFVVIGGAIGLWLTLGWVILSAIIGILVLRHEARFGQLSVTRDMQSLRDPTSPIASRALTVVAAVLLVLPGFLTDAIGLLLLLRIVQRPIIRFLSGRISQGAGVRSASVTIEGEWDEVPPSSGQTPSDGSPGRPSEWTRH
jgi:UPF0716 protein FxsA